MKQNRPAERKYKPTHEIAYIWLDAAKKGARKQRAPFKGRGSLDALNAALDNGIISYDEVEEIFSKCVSISPSELHKVFNKLWALNSQQHFPLQPIETGEGHLILPPSLLKVFEEYLAQIDYVAKAFQRFLPDSERKGTSHRDGEVLDLFYNPGTRVTPDEYDEWLSQWMENGPPKEWWHRIISISVKLPDKESVFERWNQSLANARRLTPNGVEIIELKPEPSKRMVEKLRAYSRQGGSEEDDFEPELTSELIEFPPFNIEELIATTETLFNSDLPHTSRRNSYNTSYAAKVVSRLATELIPGPEEIDFLLLDEKERIREIKKLKRHQSIRENLQTEWTNSFAALNDISDELFGQNLQGIHSRIVDDLALRTLGMIPQKRLNTGAQELLEKLRPTIPTGSIVRPVFER